MSLLCINDVPSDFPLYNYSPVFGTLLDSLGSEMAETIYSLRDLSKRVHVLFMPMPGSASGKGLTNRHMPSQVKPHAHVNCRCAKVLIGWKPLSFAIISTDINALSPMHCCRRPCRDLPQMTRLLQLYSLRNSCCIYQTHLSSYN